MKLSANVFDAWVFRKTGRGVECLLLYTSQQKADRYVNGGRVWQIPIRAPGLTAPGRRILAAVRLIHSDGRFTARVSPSALLPGRGLQRSPLMLL